MIKKMKQAMRGFTLIELLVVIAIIGLLASIVLVSLSTARRKARDSRRIGDLRQVQLALELYFDAQQSYPPNAAVAAGALYTAVQAETAFTAAAALGLLVPTYVGGLPVDPTNTSGSQKYGYIPGNNVTPPANCTAVSCLHYLLEVTLEDAANTALSNDNDDARGGFAANNGFVCTDPVYCVGA